MTDDRAAIALQHMRMCVFVCVIVFMKISPLDLDQATILYIAGCLPSPWHTHNHMKYKRVTKWWVLFLLLFNI